MDKRITAIFGASLIFFGLAALFANFISSLFGFSVWGWGFARTWPLLVILSGLAFVVPPLVWFQQRGLSYLWIPGLPLVTTGGILLAAAVTEQWGIWSVAWPLEVLSLAVAFLFIGLWTRNVWLGIPAILIGMNGLVLQFCALTGLWDWWSFLWTVEPLALGMVFLLIAAQTRSSVMFILSMATIGFAGLSLIGMLLIVSWGGWFFRLAGPAILITAGGILLAASMLRRKIDTPPDMADIPDTPWSEPVEA